MKKETILESKIEWKQQKNDKKFFRAHFNGCELELRLNNFPEEPLYTVLGEFKFDLDDLPSNWTVIYLK